MRVPSFLNRVPKRLQFCNFPSYKIKISIFYPFFNRTLERPLFYRFPFFSLKKIIFSFFLTGRLKGSVFSFISPFPQNRPVLKMPFSCSLRMPCLLFYTFFLFLQYLSSFFAIFRHFSPPTFPPFHFPFWHSNTP